MKLEEIEKLCEEATSGPWTWYYYKNLAYIESPNEIIINPGFNITEMEEYGISEDKDALFIAASRELIPKLLAVAKAVQYHVENRIVDPDDRLKKALKDLENS